MVLEDNACLSPACRLPGALLEIKRAGGIEFLLT